MMVSMILVKGYCYQSLLSLALLYRNSLALLTELIQYPAHYLGVFYLTITGHL